MSTTRRGALGAALTAPLLARFTGTAFAESEATGTSTLGTISDGWVEVHWTAQTQAQLDHFNAVVEAVAPAQLVSTAQGHGVRFPVRSGSGDPSLENVSKAQGGGALDGGIVVRTPDGTFKLTGLRSDLRGGLTSGKCAVNGVEIGHGSVFECALSDARLSTEDVPPGQPMRVQLAEVPLRATPALMEVYAATFGEPKFTTDTVLGHVTAEGVYNPPKA